MDVLVGIIVTLAFALGGFLLALKLCPDRREKRDKFLMTALVCVALAMVVSGLVRKPVMKAINAPSGPRPITEALQRNELFALVREAAPDVAESFLAKTETMAAQAQAEGMQTDYTDWGVSALLWEKLVPGGVGIAPDEAALKFAAGLSGRLRALAGEDPQKALALLAPRAFPDADPAIMALTGPFGEGVRAVVMGAYRESVPLYDPEQSALLFEQAMREFVTLLAEKRGQAPDLSAQLALLADPEALQRSGDPTLPLTIADMLDYLLARPDPDAAVLVKHVFSGPE